MVSHYGGNKFVAKGSPITLAKDKEKDLMVPYEDNPATIQRPQLLKVFCLAIATYWAPHLKHNLTYNLLEGKVPNTFN